MDLTTIFAEQHATNSRRVEANKPVKNMMRLRLKGHPDVKIPWCFQNMQEKSALIDEVLTTIRILPVEEILLYYEAWFVSIPVGEDQEKDDEEVRKFQDSVKKTPIRDRPDRQEAVLYYYENRSGEIASSLAYIEVSGKRRTLGSIEDASDSKIRPGILSHFFQQARETPF
jgi:hypothetical protein